MFGNQFLSIELKIYTIPFVLFNYPCAAFMVHRWIEISFHQRSLVFQCNTYVVRGKMYFYVIFRDVLRQVNCYCHIIFSLLPVVDKVYNWKHAGKYKLDYKDYWIPQHSMLRHLETCERNCGFERVEIKFYSEKFTQNIFWLYNGETPF